MAQAGRYPQGCQGCCDGEKVSSVVPGDVVHAATPAIAPALTCPCCPSYLEFIVADSMGVLFKQQYTVSFGDITLNPLEEMGYGRDEPQRRYKH